MILEVNDGTFSYGNRTIFEGVTFRLPRQNIMTVLGPNGAGKTTLLRCIMCFIPWKRGGAVLDGRPIQSYSQKDMWRKVSYVPQAKRSVFSYKVLDMVIMGLNAWNNMFEIPKKEHADKAAAVLEKMGILHLSRRYCNQLSGGELQMVMIARALVSSPELLILDEPESNLDMCNQLRVLEQIERVAGEMKTACLINTHFPEHALNISDFTLLLANAGQMAFGRTKDLINEKNVELYFNVCSRILKTDIDGQTMQAILPFCIAEKCGCSQKSAGDRVCPRQDGESPPACACPSERQAGFQTEFQSELQSARRS